MKAKTVTVNNPRKVVIVKMSEDEAVLVHDMLGMLSERQIKETANEVYGDKDGYPQKMYDIFHVLFETIRQQVQNEE